MSFESLLNKYVSIQAKTVTMVKGSSIESWSLVVSNYNCRIYYVSPVLMRKETGEQVTISTKAAGFENVLIVEGCLLVDGSTKYLIEAAAPIYGPELVHHVEYGLRKVNDIGI